MRRHAWRQAGKKPVLAGYDWIWWCERCGRKVTVFKFGGTPESMARPRVGDPEHSGVSGDCDMEVAKEVLES